MQPKRPGRADPSHFHVGGIVGPRDALRVEGIHSEVGVQSPIPSWGRSSLYRRRNASNRRCWAWEVPAAGRAVSRLSSRCIRSCWPFCCGLAGEIR